MDKQITTSDVVAQLKKKVTALYLEVDSSIADDIAGTVTVLLAELEHYKQEHAALAQRLEVGKRCIIRMNHLAMTRGNLLEAFGFNRDGSEP